MDKILNRKFNRLKKQLKEFKNVAIAFSGGVDSTFLLRVAVNILGRNKVIAYIANSPTFPKSEFKEALKFVKKNKIKHEIILTNEFQNKNFISNPYNRCYFCKKILFTLIHEKNKKHMCPVILDGTNYDDRFDIRYGRKAKEENNVLSPLAECKLTKKDIRSLSKQLRLKTYNKPAAACLASRIPTGISITGTALNQVELGENFLHKLIQGQIRLRHFGKTAKIDVCPSDFKKILKPKNTRKIVVYLKKIGFKHITLDLEGYKTGSLN